MLNAFVFVVNNLHPHQELFDVDIFRIVVVKGDIVCHSDRRFLGIVVQEQYLRAG